MSTDYKNILNWNVSPELSSEIFSQSFVYDAMLYETARQNGVLSRIKSRQRSSSGNRPVELSKPDDTIEQFTYNKAGLLETVKALVRGEDGIFAVTNINYNEKGQRTDIYYGNGSKTRYDYDEETFRLKRMLTTRNMGSDILLDLNYMYDPVGNITEVDDPAQETIYYNNTEIKAKGKYTYDALYRLKTATGRELRSLQLPNQSDFANNIGFSSPEANSMQNYTQQFQYDELGNLIQMQSVNEWTRDYFYDFVEDNYLLGHTEDLIEYEYDQHGNLTQMPHLSQIDWSYKDELLNAILNASGDTAYYVYDAGGERVRKVIEKTGGIIEERVYLGGFEVYRKSVAGTLDFERETLHISDNEKKIVSIETKTVEDGDIISTPDAVIRYQYDNHLGSSTLELDHSAALISYEEYHPFGTTSYRSGSTEAEVSQKRYKYVGKERDEETGLYYYGARYYAAWLCRFVSVDPLQFDYPQLTPFQYAGNKPITYIDIEGMQAEGDTPIKADNTNVVKDPINPEKYKPATQADFLVNGLKVNPPPVLKKYNESGISEEYLQSSSNYFKAQNEINTNLEVAKQLHPFSYTSLNSEWAHGTAQDPFVQTAAGGLLLRGVASVSFRGFQTASQMLGRGYSASLPRFAQGTLKGLEYSKKTTDFAKSFVVNNRETVGMILEGAISMIPGPELIQNPLQSIKSEIAKNALFIISNVIDSIEPYERFGGQNEVPLMPNDNTRMFEQKVNMELDQSKAQDLRISPYKERKLLFKQNQN